MCLSNPRKIKVIEPIRVYKAVIHVHNGFPSKDFWKSPFRCTPIDSDIITGKKPFRAEMLEFTPSSEYVKHGIDKGYIHTYSSIEDAAFDYFTYYSNGNSENGSRVVEIYECEIPPCQDDNYCWKGNFDIGILHVTAARQINFIRKLTEEELRKVFDDIEYCKSLNKFVHYRKFKRDDIIARKAEGETRKNENMCVIMNVDYEHGRYQVEYFNDIEKSWDEFDEKFAMFKFLTFDEAESNYEKVEV